MSWLKEIKEIIFQKNIEESEKFKENQIKIEGNKEKERENWRSILNEIGESSTILKWEEFHVEEILRDMRDLIWPGADIRVPRINLFFDDCEFLEGHREYMKKLIFCNKADLLINFRKDIETDPDNIMNHFSETQNRLLDKVSKSYIFKTSSSGEFVGAKIDPKMFKYFKIRGSICTPEIIKEDIAASDTARETYILNEHFVIEFDEEKVHIQKTKVFPLKEITSADLLKEKVKGILKEQLSS